MGAPMIAKDDPPATPDWAPIVKPWDADRCCPATCVCESAQHAVFIHTPDNVILGSE
jgi:hypothetical protein